MDFFRFIKKHSRIIIVAVVSIVIILPLGIDILFRIEAPFKWMESSLNSGELLSYYGSVLTLSGTIILSTLALWQNQKIKEESDARIQLIEAANMPKFKLIKKCSGGQSSNMELNLNNITDNPVTDVKVYGIYLQEGLDEIWKTERIFSIDRLDLNSSLVIYLNTPSLDDNEKYTIKFNLECKDKYNIKHTYSCQYIIDKGKHKYEITKV